MEIPNFPTFPDGCKTPNELRLHRKLLSTVCESVFNVSSSLSPPPISKRGFRGSRWIDFVEKHGVITRDIV